MTQDDGDELDDAAAMVPVPIHERWADADRGIVVRRGPTMPRVTYPRTPLIDDEQPDQP